MGENNDLREPSPAPPAAMARMEWAVAAWFLLGILVGVVGLTVFTTLTARPGLDAAAAQQAARNGMLEAFATLQAGSPRAASEALGASSPADAPSTPASSAIQTAFILRDANRVGDKNAPVTMVEFSDFQCPFCGRFFQTVEPALLKDYVETGKVTFVYKHSAFLGPESVWAAQAAECAADQEKFWAYHDLLFARQAGENQGAFTKDKLLSFAQELNLDMARFEPCLQNDETLGRVQADTQEGEQAGVSGTPTFYINGQPLVGAQPYQEFQAVLEQLLASSE